jgi:hypothetical protein
MEKVNIDRLALYHDPNFDGDFGSAIQLDTTEYMTKWKTHWYHFSLMPSLWKSDSLVQFHSKFSNCKYGETEGEECQSYSKNHMNVYFLYSSISNTFIWKEHGVVPYFEFIHVSYLDSYDTYLLYGAFQNKFFELNAEYGVDIHRKIKQRIDRK